MEYKDLLKSYIDASGMSLREIEEKMRSMGFSTNKAYISKLQNGVHPPAGEDITRALAEVTGGDIDALLLAGHIEKAPDEIKSYLKEATDRGELFGFFGLLITYVEHYRETGAIDEDILEKIEFFNKVFTTDYKYWIDTSLLKDYPEHAVELIARLKQHFVPLANSISAHGATIHFSDYITPEGRPKFKENPYPEILSNVEKNMNILLKEEQVPYVKMNKVIGDQTQKKIDFFTNLENDLGLDLADPDVQKKLKRAAKIIFSNED